MDRDAAPPFAYTRLSQLARMSRCRLGCLVVPFFVQPSNAVLDGSRICTIPFESSITVVPSKLLFQCEFIVWPRAMTL
jgi:hypothetical protein